MIEVRRACVADAARMVLELRAQDWLECNALGDPERVIIGSIVNSLYAWCALDNGVPVAMWGCSGDDSDIQLWCLTGRRIVRHKRRMLAENKRFIESFAGHRMHAHVSAAYWQARRWLAWLGFVEVATIQTGDHTFIRVEHDGRIGNSGIGVERIRRNRGRHEAECAGSTKRANRAAECPNGGIARWH